MRLPNLLLKGFSQLLIVMVWTQLYAQSLPTVPGDIEFAGVSVQLTPSARQRLQQTLTNLYSDRALLLNQIETLNQLRPALDTRLTVQNVPLDFRYVCPPFTESPYDPYAYWGLRQPLTGQLQLLVNQSVDDRRHVLIATDAVLPYLNRLRQQQGHWIKALFQHLDASVKLPATANNATRWLLDLQTPTAMWTILARKIAFEHEQTRLKLAPTFILLEYNEGDGKTLAEIAGRLKINTDRLSPYNTWLLANRIPASGSFPVILRLTPAEYLSVKARIAGRETAPSTTNLLVASDLGFPILRRADPGGERQSAIFYQINERRGIQAQLCDNAITLAYYGHVSVPAFLTINDLPTQEITLRPGEVYYLQRKARKAKIPFHVVQQSQTLWDISAMYGIRLKSLLRYNRIKPNQRVQTGRIVWMQRKRPVQSPIEYQLPASPGNIIPEQITPIISDTTIVSDSVSALPLIAVVTPVAKPMVPVPAPAQRSIMDSVVKPVEIPAKPMAAPMPVSSDRINKVHIVKPGQTYFSIAKLYGTTVERLCSWNRVSVDDPLLVGQELLIETITPVVPAPVRQQSAPVNVPAAKPVTTYTLGKRVQYYSVKGGETIYRIALNHAVSVPDLMRWNNLKNFTIEIGQRLIIWQPIK